MRFRWAELQLKSRGLGARRESVSAEQFLSLEIPLPLLAEQQRIVARIEELAAKVEEARKLRQLVAEEREALVKAHLNQLFGNPYDGTKGKLGISRWELVNAVAEDVADGPHITPTYVAEGIPFLTVLNITSGRIQFADHKFIMAEDHRQFQKRAKAERGRRVD